MAMLWLTYGNVVINLKVTLLSGKKFGSRWVWSYLPTTYYVAIEETILM